jgi:ADP-heptose:LPS heptosyltransferase
MIILSPFSKQLKHGGANPKSPPISWWAELITYLPAPLVQIGVQNDPQILDDFRMNLSLPELSELILQCKTWIAVDSFIQHLGWDLGKPGVVIWGPSDPLIYGHPENINLIKDRSCLIPNQFSTWEEVTYDETRFLSPMNVIESIPQFL